MSAQTSTNSTDSDELRDHFAAVALPVAFEAIMRNNGIPGSAKAQSTALVAYELADAMIAARGKR